MLADLISNHLLPLMSVSYQIRLKYPVDFLVSLDSDFDWVGAVATSLIEGFLKRIWIKTHQIKHPD